MKKFCEGLLYLYYSVLNFLAVTKKTEIETEYIFFVSFVVLFPLYNVAIPS